MYPGDNPKIFALCFATSKYSGTLAEEGGKEEKDGEVEKASEEEGFDAKIDVTGGGREDEKEEKRRGRKRRN